MARKCGTCGQSGHNSRTCKAFAHEALEQQTKTTARKEDISGAEPKRGLWIVNRKRKRVYGRISYFKARTGQVTWEDALNTTNYTDQDVLIDNECEFVDLEPFMLQWEVPILSDQFLKG